MMKLIIILMLLIVINGKEFVLIPLESEEQGIIAEMAQTEEWREELRAAPTIEEWKNFYQEAGYRIESAMVVRELKMREELREWLWQEVIPELGLAEKRKEAFVEGVLSWIEGEWLIQRRLVLEAER